MQCQGGILITVRTAHGIPTGALNTIHGVGGFGILGTDRDIAGKVRRRNVHHDLTGQRANAALLTNCPQILIR